jgi:hypothetical protein
MARTSSPASEAMTIAAYFSIRFIATPHLTRAFGPLDPTG